MTADQLGENSPKLETVLAGSSKLPSSDDELVQCIRQFAHVIRASFNDYALGIGTDRDQPIKIPALRDIITLFCLEDEVKWGDLGPIEEALRSRDGASIVRRSFEGFDPSGQRLFTGVLERDKSSDDPGIDFFERWRREFYGTSGTIEIRKYAPEETENNYTLHYHEPIDSGSEIVESFGIKYTNRSGVRCAVSYDGAVVKKTRWLNYWDEAEKYGLHYYVPFFERGKNDLTKVDVEAALNLSSWLYNNSGYLQDPHLQAFVEEIGESDKTYSDLKNRLGLDKLNWYEVPIYILRLSEIAQYLEYKYRYRKGLSEIPYQDYSERLKDFKKFLWRSLTGFDPNWKPPISLIETKSWGYNNSFNLPTCPYPKIAFPGSLCFSRCWLKFCPRGLGPFDPGPHNYGGPGDPRGSLGPDPRGPDPRGPR